MPKYDYHANPSQAEIDEFVEQLSKAEETSVEEVQDLYKELAPYYDQYVIGYKGYNGPRYTAEKVGELYPDRTTSILDICAGSGNTGRELKKLGFTNVTAHDGNPQMLEEACKKEAYNDKMVCAMVGDTPLPIDDDSYDCVMSCGAFHLGHIPVDALSELSRCCKPGGQVVFTNFIPDQDERGYDLNTVIDRLEKEGKWKVVERKQVESYWHGFPAFLITCKVL